jgi:protein SCO1/2
VNENPVGVEMNRDPAATGASAVDRFLWVALIAILAGLAGLCVVLLRRPPTTAPATSSSSGGGTLPSGEVPPRPLPDFSLVDHTGKPVRLADLNGHVWVADFFFTSCPGKCPMVSMRMAELQKAIPADAAVKLVSITVDPDRDSPEVLGEYAKQFGAQDGRWLFLTGDKQAIMKLSNEGFLLRATNDPNDHSMKLTLVDAAGQIRGYFDGGDEASVTHLRREIRELLGETKPDDD